MSLTDKTCLCVSGIYTCSRCMEAAVPRQKSMPKAKKDMYPSKNVTIAMSATIECNLSTGNGFRGKKKSTNPSKKESLRTPSIIRSTSTDDISLADCKIHGYKIVKTIGQGTHATVKLAKVMAATLERLPEMSSQADKYGNVKVNYSLVYISNPL